jgi:hypothetical protein
MPIFDSPELRWPPEDPLDPKLPEINLSGQLLHFVVDGRLSYMSVSGTTRKSTEAASIQVFAGTGVTDDDGHWEVNLLEVSPAAASPWFDTFGWPSVTATPCGQPALIATSFRRIDEGKRLFLGVDSYYENASKRPLTAFAWQCVVEANLRAFDADLGDVPPH